MGRRPVIALAVLVAWLSSAPRAQTLPFEVLGVNEGLPQSQVGDVAQDSEGYIWAGTWGGLARYNGDAFSYVFAGKDLPSNRVQKFLPARSGEFWIATTAGLSMWKDHTFHVPSDPLVSGIRCRALAEDASGLLWVGTDQGILVKTPGGFRRIETPGPDKSPRVYDLLADRSGMLAVTTSGLFRCTADGACSAVAGPPVPPESLRTAWRTAEGLWIGAIGRGLWREASGTWTQELSEFRDLDVYRLCSDRAGTLFVCTANAGLFLRRAGRGFEHWTTREGLPSNVVNAVLEDREGNLWVGTDIGGLARLGNFSITNYGTSPGFPSPCIFGINAGGAPGTLWIGTLQGAVHFRHSPSPEILETLSGRGVLPNDLVWEVAQAPGGDLWVLTDSAVLVRPAGRKVLEEVGRDKALDRGAATDLLVEDSGRVWLAGEDPRGGLCLRLADGTWRRWGKAADGTPADTCRAVAPRRAGGVWVATERGVMACDGETLSSLGGSPFPASQSDRPRVLLEDRLGRLWAGTEGGLLVRETDGRWHAVEAGGVFAEHNVFSLGEDAQGTIWVGTARGAYRIGADGAVAPFTPQDGLAAYECNQSGLHCDEKGDVWIGTVGGLSRFSPAGYRTNTVPPRVIVESADYAGASVPFPEALHLSWPQRTVTFHVAVLAYRGHQRAFYRARMEGLETEWLPRSRPSDLRYTNLPPGDHVLILQAVNESGVWGEELRPANPLFCVTHARAMHLYQCSCPSGHRNGPS